MTIPATRLTNTGNHFINGTYDEGDLITNGLLTYIDFTDRSSSPSTGTSPVAITDLSGNGRNWVTQNGCKLGTNGVELDGVASYVYSNLNGYYNSWSPGGLYGWPEFTIDLVFSTSSNVGVLISRPWSGSGEYNYTITTTGFQLNVYGRNASLTWPTLATGQIVHLTCWMNQTQFGWYLNGGQSSGVQNHGLTGSGGLVATNVFGTLIGSLYPYGQGWNGLYAGNPSNMANRGTIYRFGMYNRQLTSSEVLQNYNASIIKKKKNTLQLLSSQLNAKSFDEVSSTSPIIDSSLILYLDPFLSACYPGTGTTLYDLSGKGNNGTLVGSPAYNSLGFLLNPLGTNTQYITVPTVPFQMGYDSFTISVWVKVQSTGGSPALFGSTAGSNTSRYALGTSAGQFFVFARDQNSNQQQFNSPNVNLNTFNNAVMVVNRTLSTISLYVNGILINSLSAPWTTAIDPNGGTAGSGFIVNGGPPFLNGTISTTLVYRRALSTTEIQTNYNALARQHGLSLINNTTPIVSQRTSNTGDTQIAGTFDEVTGMPVVDSSLVLWHDTGQTSSYPGTGTIIYDLSGQGNNGIINGKVNYINNTGGQINFDGLTNYINVPSSPSLNFDKGDFTISFWQYTTLYGLQGASRINKGNNTSTGWGERDETFMLYSSLGRFALINSDVSPLYVWRHVCFVVSQTSPYIKKYGNGILTGTSAVNGSEFPALAGSVSNSVDCTFGLSTAGGLYRYLSGILPVVQIYNRALSASEVQQNFNAIRGRYGI